MKFRKGEDPSLSFSIDRQMASNAQDDIGGQVPSVDSGNQQGDDIQEISVPHQETQQHNVHAESVQVSCMEANLEPPAYIPSGRDLVTRHEEIKHLQEKISQLEECLEREKSKYLVETEAIKKEKSKIEQELNIARSQLRQTTMDKDIQLGSMTGRLRANEAEICAKDAQLRAKDTALHAKDEQMKVKEAELHVKDEQIKAKDVLLQAKDEHIKAKDTELCAKDERLKAKDSELCAKGEQIKAKESEVCARDERLKAKDSELCTKDEQIKAKESEVCAKDEQLKSKDEQLKSKDVELSTKDEQLKSKDKQLCDKDANICDLKGSIKQLEAKYAELTEQQKQAKSRIKELETLKSQLEEELKSKRDTIFKLESECQAKDEVTKTLQMKIATHHEEESQITAPTNNTGVGIHMPQNEPAKISNGSEISIASQNDPNEVVLPGPSISFWKNKELGRGAFATVYEGVFNSERCAVKILNQVAMQLISDLPTGPCDDTIQRKAIQSFTKECSCLMTINHPNIVKLIDVRTYDKGNFPVLIMERLDCSLTAYFKQHPNQNMEHSVLLSICCDVASALNYLHENRIVHRDICGNNILLILDGQTVREAKVSDFGMSRILKDFEGMSTTLTTIDGHRAAYYPPELQDDYGSSDSSIDIYMFGVLMLQIAHGIPCVKSRIERKGLIQRLSERHVLKGSIMWCTESEKNKRPTARNVHANIKSLLEEYRQKLEMKNNPPQESNTTNL